MESLEWALSELDKKIEELGGEGSLDVPAPELVLDFVEPVISIGTGNAWVW